MVPRARLVLREANERFRRETQQVAVRGKASGDGWARFYLEHRHSLTAYAFLLVENATDAQDLIQDVLVRMVALDRPVRRAKPFVLRCMRNLAIDRRRAAHAAPGMRQLADADVTLLDTEAGDAARQEATERLRRALACLPADHREVIVMKTYVSMTFREIAEVLERPIGSITSLYARGLDELRSLCDREVNHVDERGTRAATGSGADAATFGRGARGDCQCDSSH